MYSLLITFALIATLFSFLCSLWEAVLLSITPSYAQAMITDGHATGKRLQEFKDNIDRPLAAILSLNTAAHTIGAVGVGSQASIIWAEANPLITSVAVPVVMTLVILILSEIVPKTIGANHWQKLTPFTVNSVVVVIYLLYPLVWLGQFLTQWLKKDKSQSVFSHAEFLALAEIGVEEGQVEAAYPEIIGNLLSLGAAQAKDVLTPRTVVVTASQDQSIRDFYRNHKNLPFSRIPLTRAGDSDVITGYFLKDTMLECLLHGWGSRPLRQIRHDIITVPETFTLRTLFNTFIERREHIALVVDEFGGMAGIVTMEDIIESLIGTEILDESDLVSDMRKLAREEWERHSREKGVIRYEE
jgi:CBS domain containing-hemolysin-like protein